MTPETPVGREIRAPEDRYGQMVDLFMYGDTFVRYVVEPDG